MPFKYMDAYYLASFLGKSFKEIQKSVVSTQPR